MVLATDDAGADGEGMVLAMIHNATSNCLCNAVEGGRGGILRSSSLFIVPKHLLGPYMLPVRHPGEERTVRVFTAKSTVNVAA